MTDRSGNVLVEGEVAAALAEQRPVVALESALITTGLPREEADAGGGTVNLAAAQRLCDIISGGGAVPAVVAVIAGQLRIGLDAPTLTSLAADATAGKTSAADLAYTMTAGRTAGTTVSATLAACRIAEPHPIRTFATGGIGGVHRQWTVTPDISADLGELARTPCCVVSAGAKAVLDVPATLELLESLGVAVVGYRTERFPQFYSAGSEALDCHRLDDVEQVARLCRTRWDRLGQRSGVLLAQTLPASESLPADELEQLLKEAATSAANAGIRGREVTPFLLADISRRTQGRSLRANIALLEQNARLAAELAIAMSGNDT